MLFVVNGVSTNRYARVRRETNWKIDKFQTNGDHHQDHPTIINQGLPDDDSRSKRATMEYGLQLKIASTGPATTNRISAQSLAAH